MKAFIPHQTALNIAEVWSATRALGPGIRSVVWVQGCQRTCQDCYSPEWSPQVPAWQVSPEELANLILKDPRVCGLTFSGGEPMLQAAGLANLARSARLLRELDIICFTGFTYAELLMQSSGSPVHELLTEIDVLIDGPYIEALNDNKGLRGSSNQRIHYLTDRLNDYDLENGPRIVEFHFEKDSIMVVGVPPRDIQNSIEKSIKNRGYPKTS